MRCYGYGDLRMVGSHAGGCGRVVPESGSDGVPADISAGCASPWWQHAGAPHGGVCEGEKRKQRTTLLEKQRNNDSTEVH
jgi:hypothetical protein